jgi:hypothetical protein
MDLFILILGVVGIARGKFTLSKGHVVEGQAARAVGLMVAGGAVLAIASSFVVGWVAARKLQGMDSLTAEEFLRLDTIAMALNAGIVVVLLAIALVVARRNAREPLTTMECPSRRR